MSEVRVTTDHKWRQFRYWYEVPRAVLADQFNYLTDEDTDGFFCYRGTWYHTSQFEHVPSVPNGATAGWHGYAGDSFFSGVLIELSGDGEEYRVGTLTC